MILLRILLICTVFLGSFLSQNISATERLEVQIRSTILNIRETRSTQSPVVGVLSLGDRLTVTTTDERDWIRLDDGRGFISINYVTVLSRTPVLFAPPEVINTPETEGKTPTAERLSIETIGSLPKDGNTTQTKASINLSREREKKLHQADIESVSKTCRKNLNTRVYEFCQLLFKIKLPDNISPDQQITISCSAEALTVDSKDLQVLYELTNTRTISGSLSVTSVIVEWFAPKQLDLIKYVSLKEKGCRISSTVS